MNDETPAQYEALLLALSEGGVGVAVIDQRRKTLLSVNDALCKMLGRTRAALLALQSYEPFVQLIGDRAGGAPGPRQLVVRTEGRAPIEIAAQLQPLEGGLSIVILRDVTSERRLQAQLYLSDRLAAMGALAAGIAHELNNPLAYVLSNLDYAQKVLESEPARLSAATWESLRDALADAHQGALRAGAIVGDMKLFSRIEGPAQRLPVDVRVPLRSALNVLAPEVRHRKARLELHLPDVPQVLADEGRLGQVFLNLCVNALQAMPGKREHRLAVSCSASQGKVCVSIEDDGTGIPLEVQPKVFDPFFTTKPAGEGTGLGLPLCQSLVTEMGGTIEFDSEPGKGTRFRVLLPV